MLFLGPAWSTMATKNTFQGTKAFKIPGAMDEIGDKLVNTPSVFTLKDSGTLNTVSRLEEIKIVLTEEIKHLEKLPELLEHDGEELAQAYNLLTWLEFKVGSQKKALELNKKALDLTGAAFSLGNRAHLMWCDGDSVETKVWLSRLDRLKREDSQGHQKAETHAHQAYCYLRFGGLNNLLESIALYEKALSTNPNCYLWKLQAGIAYKRLAHPNFLKKGETIDRDLKAMREETARSYFQDVSQHSPNPRLKAFAFSDLASMASIKGDPPHLIRQLCDGALEHNCESPYVLLHCGKSLIRTDISKARQLLEKASDLGPSSHVSFELARCLMNLSKKTPRSAEYFRSEAEKSYREAVRQAPTNMPARYSLALLLENCGKVKEAQKECMKIITTVISQDQCYAQTLMKAYEKAALYQLELCNDKEFVENLSPPVSVSILKDEAENMLIIALEIGFNLLSRTEIETRLRNSLASLFSISLNKKDTSEALQLLSRVFGYAKRPQWSLLALDKLLKHVSDDPDVVVFALKSYHNLGSYEKAYALLQMSIARLGSSAIDDNLHRQLALSAAYARLQFNNRHASLIFRSEFKRCCVKTEQLHGAQSPSTVSLTEPEQGDNPAGDQSLDVLIFYDDSRDGSQGLSTLGSICRELQKAIQSVFGLNVSQNLQV